MSEATGRPTGEPVADAADEEVAAVIPPVVDEAAVDAAAIPVAHDDADVDAAVPGAASPRRTRRSRGSAVAGPTAASGAESGAESAVPSSGAGAPGAAGRAAALRVARLHLRMGQLLLARAQLEALAGRGGLDEGALLDLAEARWRTGDLAGAGEAAGTLLANGSEDLLALLIAAESVAALGRPGEARRLARRALALADGSLDATFAGMPRNAVWPEDPRPAAVDGGMPVDGVAAGPVEHLGHVPRLRHVAPTGEVEGPAAAAAAEAFAGGRAALAGGDVGLAALRLGVALRLDAGFAEGVLDAVGDWDRDPALALVAGDALRLLGREAEAHLAFDRARGRS